MSKIQAQAFRFARLFVAALAVQLSAISWDQHVGRSVLIAAGVGAVEVAWRQFKPPADPPVADPTAPDQPIVTPKEG